MINPQLLDLWQVVWCHYWDQGLYPKVFQDRVNPQEYPTRSDVVLVSKVEGDLQTACHMMMEFVSSDRGTLGRG